MAKKKFTDYATPLPKQRLLMSYIGTGFRIFYGGARGGGKSFASLMCAVAACLQHAGISVVIVRGTYRGLEEYFINKIKVFFPEKAFGYKYVSSRKCCEFSNGSKLYMRSCDDDEKVANIQGLEYQLMIIDEAPLIRWVYIERMLGSLRRNINILADFLPTLIMTGNPGGISDHELKIRYVNPKYEMWSKRELKLKDKMVYIKSTIDDNPHVGKEYEEEVLDTISDDNLYEAWRNGNWDVFEGQFFTMWDEKRHVIPEFEIPSDWMRFGGFDLGYTEKHPSVFLDLAYDRRTGNIYVVNEYVGWSSVESHVNNISRLIGNKEQIVYADPSIWSTMAKREGEQSPGNMFTSAGLLFVPGNNDRINGWRNLKQWLNWDLDNPPQLYIFDRCTKLKNAIPKQIYDKNKDDLNTKNDGDDELDALRYAVYSSRLIPKIRRDSDFNPIDYVHDVQLAKEEECISKSYGARYSNTFGLYDDDEFPINSRF